MSNGVVAVNTPPPRHRTRGRSTDRLPDVSKTRDEPSRDRGKDTRRRGQQAVPIPTDTPPWTWLGYGYTITCPRALHCPAAAAHGQCLAITGNAAPSINQSINRSTVHAASRGPSADPRHRGRATHVSAARRRVNYTQTCACASAGVTKLLLLLYLLFTNTQLYFHHKM